VLQRSLLLTLGRLLVRSHTHAVLGVLCCAWCALLASCTIQTWVTIQLSGLLLLLVSCRPSHLHRCHIPGYLSLFCRTQPAQQQQQQQPAPAPQATQQPKQRCSQRTSAAIAHQSCRASRSSAAGYPKPCSSCCRVRCAALLQLQLTWGVWECLLLLLLTAALARSRWCCC
jgi:hypothetical protein